MRYIRDCPLPHQHNGDELEVVTSLFSTLFFLQSGHWFTLWEGVMGSGMSPDGDKGIGTEVLI